MLPQGFDLRITLSSAHLLLILAQTAALCANFLGPLTSLSLLPHLEMGDGGPHAWHPTKTPSSFGDAEVIMVVNFFPVNVCFDPLLVFF